MFCYMHTLCNDYHIPIISPSYVCVCVCVCVVRTLKIQSPSKFQAHNTVLLTIITMLCTRSPEDPVLIEKA